MVNSPHLLENLILSDNGTVDGINEGLDIWGKVTFKFTITNDNGRPHNIHIPNSLHLPGLKKCLLSPQHWVQEAGDSKTYMGISCIAVSCNGAEARRLYLSSL
jgi:hypothetical protein